MEEQDKIIGATDESGLTENITTAADETIVTPVEEAVVTSADETIITPAHETVIAPADETVVAAADETVVASADKTVVVPKNTDIEPEEKPQPKHFREVLASLPSLDAEPEQAEAAPTGDETVVITHESPASEEPVFVPETIDASSDEQMALSSLVTPIEEGTITQTGATMQETEVAAPLISESVIDGNGVQSVESPFTQYKPGTKSGNAKKILKRVLIILIAVAGALAVIYAVVAFYFTSHFLPNTTVNGEDVSGMAVSDLSTYVKSIGDNYKIHISGDGIDTTVPGSDINFVYDGDAYSKQAADQIDPWRWPLTIGNDHTLVVDEAISFDNDKLNEIVGAAVDAVNKDASQPTNATMTYDEASAKYVVVPDALGTAVNRDAVLPIASEGVKTMQTEVKLAESELVQPTVTKDDEKLNGTVSTANTLLDATYTLRIADQDATTIDRSHLVDWLSIDGENNIQVNKDAVKEWTQGPLSEQFDTTGTKRSYTRPDGKQIEVEGSTPEYDYGWCIDGEALADILVDHLQNSNTDPIDVPMKRSAATWNPGGQDWPARYIDVDLSEQYVRMYDESSNVIWEAPCVSGNPIYNGGTQTGVYFIYDKSSPMELVGRDYDGDGQPDYRTWVTYWMPFDGGEGLHDMSSRGAFGGSIYAYNGSHGCVNLPYYSAEQLYQITNVGDPVIVHW